MQTSAILFTLSSGYSMTEKYTHLCLSRQTTACKQAQPCLHVVCPRKNERAFILMLNLLPAANKRNVHAKAEKGVGNIRPNIFFSKKRTK
jgi:hypothetical protein